MTEAIRPPAPEAKITLDRERTLRCDLYAMRLFKEKTGISLLKGEFRGQTDEETLPEFVWAFLAHEDPELTIDQVAKELHPGNLGDVMQQVMALIEESLPERPDGAADVTEDGEEAEDGGDPLGGTA